MSSPKTLKISFGARLLSQKGNRASVVPYTLIDGELYFLFAIDAKSKDVTDMGGGVRGAESLLAAAIREFKEESYEIFPATMYHMDRFLSLPVLSDGYMVSIFYYIDPLWRKNASILFDEKRRSPDRKIGKCYEETQELRWYSMRGLLRLLQQGNCLMWKRVKSFYKRGLTQEFLELIQQYVSL